MEQKYHYNVMSKHDEEYEFNPVKEQIGGKEAERVIWTTSVINKAITAIGKGQPLKVNPFIGKNTKLLKPNLLYKRTQEEMDDYMVEMYNKLVQPDDICYHLGDFGDYDMVKYLNGKVILIMGNYERKD